MSDCGGNHDRSRFFLAEAAGGEAGAGSAAGDASATAGAGFSPPMKKYTAPPIPASRKTTKRPPRMRGKTLELLARRRGFFFAAPERAAGGDRRGGGNSSSSSS